MTNLNVPFSLYDFLGYLFPSVILIAALIIAVPEGVKQTTEFFVETQNFKYIIFVVILLLVYGLGHLISSIGSILFEKILVSKYLGYPENNFFYKKNYKKIPFLSFENNYSDDFINSFYRTFNAVFPRFKNPGPGDIFKLCFTNVKENSPITYNRLFTFISLYDFSRNSATSLIIIATIFLIKSFYAVGVFNIYLGLCFVSILFAFLFMLRYLKFFGIYADEVFRTFNEINKDIQ